MYTQHMGTIWCGDKKQVSERVTCFAENIIRTGGRVGWGFMFNVQVAIK